MSSRLKKDIFKLLREDEEFRYAIIGLLGLENISGRLDRLEDIIKRLVQISKEHSEEIHRLREDMIEGFKRHDEILIQHSEEIHRLREDMIEGFKRHDEILIQHSEEIHRLREDMARGFKEHDKRFIRIENELLRLREDMTRGFEAVNRHIDALGARWGLASEEAFRNALKGILEKEFNVKVTRWTYDDKEGYVYGYPSIVEVDIAVEDDRVMLIEIKSSISISDVYSFKKKAELFEKVSGRKVTRLIIVTPYIDEKAKEVCKNLNIELYEKY